MSARRASRISIDSQEGTSSFFYTFNYIPKDTHIIDPFISIARVQYGTSADARGSGILSDKPEESTVQVTGPTNVKKNTGFVAMKDNNLVWERSMFELDEKLGEGSYGAVYLGRFKPTPTLEFAIKIMDIGDPEAEEDAQNEYEVLKHINHPGIINYYGLCKDDTKNELWIIMELARTGSIMDLIHTLEAPLHEAEIAYITRSQLEALVYLHEDRHIIHRDIKCGNVLVNPDGRCKLADFGVSRLFSESENNRQTTSLIGTAHWVSPEVWSFQEQVANDNGDGYSFPADIWSLGITVYEMAVGLPPHSDTTPAQIYTKIMQYGPPQLPEEDHELPFSQMSIEDLEQLRHQGAHNPDTIVAPDGSPRQVKIPQSQLKAFVASRNNSTNFGGPPSIVSGQVEAGACILGPRWREYVASQSGIDLNSPNLNPAKTPSRWSLSLRGFLAHCLTMNPHKRPSATRLLTHPFVRYAPGPEVLVPRIRRYLLAKQLASKQKAQSSVSSTHDSIAGTSMTVDPHNGQIEYTS